MVAAEKSARLETADIMKLEPPLTLQALIERIGYISRTGLSDSSDIYTESMLSRLFGAKTITARTVNDAPNTVGFFSAEYILPYAQGVKTEFDGRWIQSENGNTSTTLHFRFGAGGPDRSTLETMLGTKLVEIQRPPVPHPHGRPPPATSPDGYKQFRADTQADPAVGLFT